MSGAVCGLEYVWLVRSRGNSIQQGYQTPVGTGCKSLSFVPRCKSQLNVIVSVQVLLSGDYRHFRYGQLYFKRSPKADFLDFLPCLVTGISIEKYADFLHCFAPQQPRPLLNADVVAEYANRQRVRNGLVLAASSSRTGHSKPIPPK